MRSNTYKRFLLIFIGIFFSWFIWEINISLGNPCNTFAFTKCFLLSTTTFLIIYTPFEIYWSFRDLWFDRWLSLSLKELEMTDILINVSNEFLSGIIVKHKDPAKLNSKNSIIIVCHGFSDTKENLQYYYYPLALQGYIILAYDARGTGKSKKTGKRSHFLDRIDDFKTIIKWVKSNKEYSSLKIHCIGFSIGALTILCGGFQNDNIEKIIAISSISKYKQNMPKYNPIILLSYFMKGVKLFPNYEENQKLSPYMVIDYAKNNLSQELWEKFSKRVMLIHSENDKIIKIKNLQENAFILESPKNNLVILKKGGHSQKKNECALVGATLSFLNS